MIDPLRLFSSEPITINEFLRLEHTSNLLVIGGPNSNLFTMLAWELDGPDLDRLRRPEEIGREPLIPLRWFGLSDRTDKGMLQQPKVGWDLEGVGPVSTTNWGLVDTAAGEVIYGEVGGEFTDRRGDTAHHIESNHVILTRMPNFLYPHFDRLDPLNRPELLVFQGMHGIGTRAIDLLSHGEGLQALRTAKDQLCGCSDFQLKLTVRDRQPHQDVLRDTPYDRFQKIELDPDGVHPLALKESMLIAAHQRFANIMIDNGLWPKP